MRNLRAQSILTLSTFILLLSTLTLSSCSNSLNSSLLSSTSSSSTTTTTASTTQDKFVISTATTNGTTTTPATLISLYFNTTQSTAPVTNHCNTSAAGGAQTVKSCICQFTWNQINPYTGSSSTTNTTSSSVPRIVQTAMTAVQPSFLSCSVPNVYATEIPDGTQILLTILPSSGNPDSTLFTTNTITFTKSTSVVSGSFQDSQGHLFTNIFHYACYQKFTRGITIQNAVQQLPNPTTGANFPVVIASQFCLTSATAGAPGANCASLPPKDYSAESFFYNLYVMDSEKGDINQFNSSMICPLVTEALGSNHTIGLQNQPWPLDSTFALTLSPNTTFSVGVVANTKLSDGTDPTAVGSACFAGQAVANGGPFINSCLGFAAPTNSDGTCPSFTNSSGQSQATYRLRRFIAIYPHLFDTNGQPFQNQSQGVDTIYVLDRPVTSSSNANPLKPYTMRGPKPCPFAYFDRQGTANGNIGYVASSDSNWNQKNIDGLQFPNKDGTAWDKSPSCSAALPQVSTDKSFISIRTVNINNSSPTSAWNSAPFQHLYVRPDPPYLPHYEEDPSFTACAPQATPLVDAPLHFSRNPVTGNVAWCSESYPTQNPNIQNLDPPLTPTSNPTIPTGTIAPYTSHTVKNSASSTCNATAISIPTSNYSYPVTGFAMHSSSTPWNTTALANQTCDRTATSAGLAWPRFPLLAPAAAVEAAINTDNSYQCTVSYDNGGSKTNNSTPSDGCCNKTSVFVPTSTSTGASSAHLEPDVACNSPNY